MRSIHFFKAESCMGLVNPHNSLEKRADVGVENGSEAVLTNSFLKKFPRNCVSKYIFPKPRKTDHQHFNKILGEQIEEFKKFINSNLKHDQTQVIIGGDHSVTLPSVLAVGERIGGFKNLCYVQFDSHGDINLNASSPTNNFHGMYVRVLADHFDIPEIEKLVPLKLPSKNMIYIGNLDLDQGEVDIFHRNKIKNINKETLLKNKHGVIRDFKNFISSFPYLHATFDIDVLDKTQAPATGIPAKNGLALKDIRALLDAINKHPGLSFDLTEVNPKKRGAKRTVQSAHEILAASLLP